MYVSLSVDVVLLIVLALYCEVLLVYRGCVVLVSLSVDVVLLIALALYSEVLLVYRGCVVLGTQ